ncbi:hypothetical protein SAMN05216582_13810 [Selenomonas ruminantium]|uniref:Beta-lactamase-inhibitor-like, PepSY-like n=1 Tax=Selenomonas ruminantium TaxID=971 RepID=A0A1M6XJZ0_SELRU|nr:hypothetical protein [Selenomonas ruminantium]SHL06304.1 hypothetical protein SAMN05216582_13810 [Selenomonas ruminantium]
MKMNKRRIALLMGTLLAATTAAYASVTPQQVALGGIEPGMSLEQAKSLGGEVIYADYEKTLFKNGLIVKVDDKRPDIVEEIVLKTGEVKTPAGITLGMSADKLNDAYGQADKVEVDRDDTEYKYRTADGRKEIEFTVKDGVIAKISCELRD